MCAFLESKRTMLTIPGKHNTSTYYVLSWGFIRHSTYVYVIPDQTDRIIVWWSRLFDLYVKQDF